jgi:hypothetical protein
MACVLGGISKPYRSGDIERKEASLLKAFLVTFVATKVTRLNKTTLA